MTVAAPAIAAFMVVVLLFEPPALHPSERIPTLRVLTGLVDSRRALDADEIADALALGRRGEPPTYALARVTGPGVSDPGNQPGGVLVLAPFAVDQAAVRWPCRHESLGNSTVPVTTTATNIRSVTRAAVKMSLKASRVLTRPACMAGVRVSRPNRNALCGRTKL